MSDKKELSYFTKRYAFADSVTVTGFFEHLNITSKEYVKDCNFNFVSDNVGISSLDGMFDGCVNATFSSELRISGSTITTASSAFKDCHNARIPVVDISSSSLVDTTSMFENCYSSELSGASIPSTSTSFRAMFKNAKSAFFNEISEIPGGDGDYEEVFCGCENGVFPNLHFLGGNFEAYNCRFMFYYCGSMDCGNLELDRISERITDSSYMFFSAGSDGSSTFDDSVLVFSNLGGCESMFTSSNFSFNDSFFIFNGNGEEYRGLIGTSTVTSVSRMFADCKFCGGRSPVMVIGHPSTISTEPSAVDSSLNGNVAGHYVNGVQYSITDFSGLYENSSFTTLDLRGISHNYELWMRNAGGVQDFSNMCRNCSKLERIRGFIPTNGLDYSSMFEGCASLSADLSKLFVEPNASYTGEEDYATAFNRDSPMKSYTFTNLSRMFNGCAYVYSTSDNADLVGLFKKVRTNVGNSETAYEMVDGMFPPIRIASKSGIPGFTGAKYNITGLSHRTGVIRFNSFEEDKSETSGGEMSEFGLHSEYAKRAISSGYYRYGGQFQGNDSDKCFFIMYRPEIGEDGSVVNFSKVETGFSVSLTPNGWGEIYNTDSSSGYWSDFTFDRLYAGMVCALDGTFIKFAYIGNYTRIYHERRRNAYGSYVFVTNYEMPVAFFNGLEDTISPL